MKRYGLYIGVLLIVASLLCFCLACGSKAGLGEEFSLSIGQTVSISGEDLSITFQEVLADNRCASDVVCITAGQVVCLIRVVQSGTSYNIELAQPGLYYDYSQQSHGVYKYTFKVEPYPRSDRTISEGEYRILLTVSL